MLARGQHHAGLVESLDCGGHDTRPIFTHGREEISVRHEAESLIPWVIGRVEVDIDLIVLGKQIHCLLTKSDKLTRQEQTKTLRETRAALAKFGEQISVQMFSSLKKTGMEETEKVVETWLGAASPNSLLPPKKQKPPTKGDEVEGKKTP